MGKKKSIPRVWELCEPHPDVFSGELNLALFAASLHQVETGEASSDYTEPERFFEKTFMTKSLENLLEGVLGRLSGEKDKGAPVLQLQTPFGGGKTHTLVALYHAARQPRLLSEVLKRELPLPSKPIAVAVLDGVALSPQGRKVDGLELRTLWGELAYKLGGKALYELVREADEARTAPGSELLTKLLRASAPALILMDEVLQYLVKAKGVPVGTGDLSEQTQAFLHELSVAASGLSNCVLVVSLPASVLEIAGGTPEEAQRLFDYSKKIFGRVEKVETPVAQDEVFGVLQKRLFRTLPSNKEIRAVSDAFRSYYDDHARSFPDDVRTLAYRNRMEQAYPFHPELIDLLYQRWGPHPQFQRTRGALRLLALVIRRLWHERPGSAYLIQLCHGDLADRTTRSEVVKLLGSEFDTVVTSDVLEKGRAIDEELRGDYYREKLARGLAGSIFLYSISAAAQDRGASPEELNMALLRPGLNPALATEALNRLRDRLWYLVYKDQRYRFESRPNLNKVLQDYEAGVTDERIEETIGETLSAIAGRANFRVSLWPKESRDIEDRPEPTLVIVHSQGSASEEGKKQLESFVQSCGSGYRVHKNELVFLLADQSELATARSKARKQKALEAFKASAQFRSLDDEDQTDVHARFKQSQKELQEALRRAYNVLVRPTREGLKEVRLTSRESLSAAAILADRAWQALKDQGLLVEALAPDFIKEFVWGKEQGEVALKAAYQAFLSTPGLPLLADEGVLRSAVAQGVKAGTFGYATRKSHSDPLENVTFNEELSTGLIDLDTGWLIRPEKAAQWIARPEHLGTVVAEGEAPTTPSQSLPPKTEAGSPLPKRLTISTHTQMLYPILKAAEQLKQLSGRVQLVIETDGIPPTLKQELEKLLSDYGVSHTFED